MDLCEGSLPALHSTALQCPLQCSAALQLLPGCSVTPLLDCLIDGGAPQYYFNLCHWPRASTQPIKCIYNVIFTFYPTTRTSQHLQHVRKKLWPGRCANWKTEQQLIVMSTHKKSTWIKCKIYRPRAGTSQGTRHFLYTVNGCILVYLSCACFLWRVAWDETRWENWKCFKRRPHRKLRT